MRQIFEMHACEDSIWIMNFWPTRVKLYDASKKLGFVGPTNSWALGSYQQKDFKVANKWLDFEMLAMTKCSGSNQ